MQDPSLYQQINPQFPEHELLKCPRCDSNNTKFCYYNNYNLSQPRHYCKNCRRYWTKGGSLRNIPVGGGSRKTTKRSSSSSKRTPSSSSTSTPKSEALDRTHTIDQDHRILLSANDQFRSLIEGLNSNGFGKDPNLSLNSGTDQNSVQEPLSEMNNGEKYSSVDENRGNSSFWGNGNSWPNLAVYNQDSTFQ